MTRAILAYLNTLSLVFGRGWNRFWFTPSDPFVLAPVRIGAGLMAFYLVATYTPDLETFFGHKGLVPSAASVFSTHWNPRAIVALASPSRCPNRLRLIPSQ